MLVMTAASLPTFAQKWGNTPEDSVSCVTNNFLYRDAFKNKNLDPMGSCRLAAPPSI